MIGFDRKRGRHGHGQEEEFRRHGRHREGGGTGGRHGGGRGEKKHLSSLLEKKPNAMLLFVGALGCARHRADHWTPPAICAATPRAKRMTTASGKGCETAMGKILPEKQETLPGTVTLLGCHSVDWSEDMVRETENWLADNGWKVLSRWGSRETAENFKNAAAASVNLVVDVSGLRLARYMEREFGIPYVAGAPFGKAQCDWLQTELRSGEKSPLPEGGGGEPETLVIGEQLAADAIRQALEDRGFRDVRCVPVTGN